MNDLHLNTEHPRRQDFLRMRNGLRNDIAFLESVSGFEEEKRIRLLEEGKRQLKDIERLLEQL